MCDARVMSRWLLVIALACLGGCGKKKAEKAQPAETPSAETAQPAETGQPAETTPPASAEAPAGGQSFADGMKALCDPQVDSKANPAERQMQMASWIKEHVTNREVVALFESMGELSPADREAAMDQAIAKAGLTSCPIAGK